MLSDIEEALVQEIFEEAYAMSLLDLEMEGIKVTEHDKEVLFAGIRVGADITLGVLSRRRLLGGINPDLEGLL